MMRNPLLFMCSLLFPPDGVAKCVGFFRHQLVSSPRRTECSRGPWWGSRALGHCQLSSAPRGPLHGQGMAAFNHLEKELSVSEMCVCLFFVVAETVAHTGPKL